jgi:hypothetical protein
LISASANMRDGPINSGNSMRYIRTASPLIPAMTSISSSLCNET